jgi:hypothetical protein
VHPVATLAALAGWLLAGGVLYAAGVAVLAPRELRQVWTWMRGAA